MSSPKSKLEEEEGEEENICRKRLKGRHDPIECSIELDNGIITRELMGRFVCEICKYLLYDRQQIPFPLSNSMSLTQLNDKSIHSKLNRKEELILSMVNDLNKLFDELICVMKMSEISIDCVCLSLGQTLRMPKELYYIELPKMDIYSVKHLDICNRISLRSAVTRFFKIILNDGNILFQGRKDIATTKLFLLIKLKTSFVPFLMDHSLNYHSISDESEEGLFTPHIDYELPKIGNRFKFIIKQKQCDSCPNYNYFKIYDENNQQTIDHNYVDQQLTQNLSHLLTLNDSPSNQRQEEDSIWVQIRSSIKGVQYNCTNKDELLLNSN